MILNQKKAEFDFDIEFRFHLVKKYVVSFAGCVI